MFQSRPHSRLLETNPASGGVETEDALSDKDNSSLATAAFPKARTTQLRGLQLLPLSAPGLGGFRPAAQGPQES